MKIQLEYGLIEIRGGLSDMLRQRMHSEDKNGLARGNDRWIRPKHMVSRLGTRIDRSRCRIPDHDDRI